VDDKPLEEKTVLHSKANGTILWHGMAWHGMAWHGMTNMATRSSDLCYIRVMSSCFFVGYENAKDKISYDKLVLTLQHRNFNTAVLSDML
jgi:hypothetical protein